MLYKNSRIFFLSLECTCIYKNEKLSGRVHVGLNKLKLADDIELPDFSVNFVHFIVIRCDIEFIHGTYAVFVFILFIYFFSSKN